MKRIGGKYLPLIAKGNRAITPPLLFDTIPGLLGLAARKLKASAAKAIILRENSGDTIEDIGFSGVNFDDTTYTAFVNANRGFAARLYDQSGNGNDGIQSTTTKQIEVLLNQVNGKPAFLVTATLLQLYDLVSEIPHNVPLTFAMVYKKTAAKAFELGTGSSGSSYPIEDWTSDIIYSRTAVSAIRTTAAVSINSDYKSVIVRNSAMPKILQNGVNLAINAPVVGSGSGLSKILFGDGSYSDGMFCELLVFGDLTDAQMMAVYADHKSYYNLP